MRLADDARGRVPFALVGVLLLVGASTFAAGIETTGPVAENRAVDVTRDRVTASSATALREAVHDAAREAALHPVTTPANTTAGRALSERRTFEDSLRLRIYVRARAYLRATSHERQGVEATASLQPTPDAAALREALSRVRVESVDNGTALHVTVENVSVRVTRDGRTLHRENRTLNVTAATPVAALHDRTEAYERRLNRGPLEGPGLGRQVTARLFVMAWARGYAQHGGAPIQQVLATRHVEVATNGALLGSQRATFGTADPAARRELREAAVETGVTDLVAATPAGADAGPWAWDAAEGASVNVSNESVRVPSPASSVPISVGRAADHAALRVVRGTGEPNRSLSGALRESHRATATLRTVVEPVDIESPREASAPGSGWTQVDESVSVRETVETAEGPIPGASGRERVASRFARRVEREHTMRRTWEKGNATRTTEARWTRTYRVGVAVVVEHDPNGGAPDRPTEPLFERGGALDGPNLVDTPERARETLVTEQGGRDAVAAGVLTGDVETERAVYGARPENLSSWVRRDLADLRIRVRSVSTNVSGTDLGTMRVNPAAALAARLRERRAELVAAPATYDGTADRARVAARARYVDAVIVRLDRRAAGFRRMRRAYGESLADGNASLESLAARTEAARNATGTGPRLVRGDIENATLDARGSPTYLTTAAVGHAGTRAVPRGRRYHPLVTRNVNIFTVPYGDAASAVSGAMVDEPRRVRLDVAGRTLAATNRALATTNGSENGSVREKRDALRAEVSASLNVVDRRATETLGRTTALPPATRRHVVDDAGERWTTAERARAATNGSLAAAIAATAADRGDLNATERERIESRLRLALAAAVDERATTVRADRVDAAGRATRRLARRVVEDAATDAGERATERAAEEWMGEAFAAVPAGLPVLPPPYTWYATVNVWTVEIEGAYARFSIRTDRDAPGGRLRYVRDGSTVSLDVDGDGAAERLGRNERVGFETRTVVFVVVPANGRGVGDRGIATESSSGWPNPGCTAPPSSACPAE